MRRKPEAAGAKICVTFLGKHIFCSERPWPTAALFTLFIDTISLKESC